MDERSIVVYLVSLLVLLAKLIAAMSLQAAERFRTRHFRYAEDAAFWKGDVAPDTELCTRAQALLRNDGESQPYFFVLGASYVALGAWPTGAPYYFGAYALSRLVHGYYMLRPRQPHRNRAFGVSLAVLLALGVHLAFASARLLAR